MDLSIYIYVSRCIIISLLPRLLLASVIPVHVGGVLARMLLIIFNDLLACLSLRSALIRATLHGEA